MTTLAGSARPEHVAIIMDGNGRWAQRFGRPRTFGHHRGVERVREVVRAAPDLGIKALTLFAFSTENWKRPGYEVKVLMSLLRRYIIREVDELDGMDVCVRFIGDRAQLPEDLRRLMGQMEERTAKNTRMNLQIAISYGSRHELTHAVQALADRVAKGEITAQDIDQDMISESLFTNGIKDPDLLIRTSGEKRISNFLLWQIAYAELAFVDECWPDFTVDHLSNVLANFGKRERRFGKVSAQL